jgi:hypothetical protein
MKLINEIVFKTTITSKDRYINFFTLKVENA